MLEGTVGPNGKSIKAVGATQLKILRAAREEVNVDVPYSTRIYFITWAHFFLLDCSTRVGISLPNETCLEKRVLDMRQLRRLPLAAVTFSACELRYLVQVM